MSTILTADSNNTLGPISTFSKMFKTVIELASEYGLVGKTIYRWIRQYEPFAKNEEGETVSRADLKVMQKRIAELEMENEILKKATAIFAKTK